MSDQHTYEGLYLVSFILLRLAISATTPEQSRGVRAPAKQSQIDRGLKPGMAT
jgi:hypothetical protein